MNQLNILTHAVFIGLTPLIPIPFLDDFAKAFFYKRLVRSLASIHDLSLSTSEIAILSDNQGQGCVKGCIIGFFEFIVKRLVRKVIFVLEWRRAINLVAHAYYFGFLMDYAFQERLYTLGDLDHAMQLRAALELARSSANTNLVKQVIQLSFNQSRLLILGAVQQLTRSLQDIAFRKSRIWLRRLVAVRLRQRAPRLSRWLSRILRSNEADNTQVAEVETAATQALEHESPNVRMTLGQFIIGLQESLAEVPKEHFEVLQERLKNALKPV